MEYYRVNFKYYRVNFSDGEVEEVYAANPNDAYRQGTARAIGRYVTKVTNYDYGYEVYNLKRGGFLDIEKDREAFSKEIDASLFIRNKIAEGINCTTRQGNFRYRILGHVEDNETIKITVSDSSSGTVYRTFKLTFDLEEVIKTAHEWKDFSCIHCERSFFDVADPKGLCAEEDIRARELEEDDEDEEEGEEDWDDEY